jgi:hypothetical protein
MKWSYHQNQLDTLCDYYPFSFFVCLFGLSQLERLISVVAFIEKNMSPNKTTKSISEWMNFVYDALVAKHVWAILSNWFSVTNHMFLVMLKRELGPILLTSSTIAPMGPFPSVRVAYTQMGLHEDINHGIWRWRSRIYIEKEDKRDNENAFIWLPIKSNDYGLIENHL